MSDGWSVSDELVEVDLGECRCPGAPHSRDSAWLRPELSPEGGIAAMLVANDVEPEPHAVKSRLGRVFAEYGVVAWSRVDEKGQPVPVTREAIRNLKWSVIWPIANQAALLYAEEVFRPLAGQATKSSANGHTAASTSAKPQSSSPRRKR